MRAGTAGVGPAGPEEGATEPGELSVVRGDVAFRLQRRIGLIPGEGLGVVRRALFWSLLAWLPIVVAAALNGNALAGAAGEPLLAHFGIHVRFLVAVPLLILAEAGVHAMLARVLPQLLSTGIVPAGEVGRLRDLMRRLAQRRDAALPWLVIVAVVVATTTAMQVLQRVHEIEWAAAGTPAAGFGAWWFLFVARPIFLTLALAWLWRTVLLFMLFRGIGQLGLSLVPTHPDRLGGLAFLVRVPAAFAPVVFALSAVVAAVFAHDVVYHGVTVDSLKLQMGAFVVVAVLVFVLPVFAFAGPLARARRQALADYGALVGRHGRLVHRRWIEGKAVPDDDVLAAPELGAAADVAALYGAVRSIRSVPLTRDALVPLLAAAAVPMLAVLAIEIPLGKLLGLLLKALL